MAGLRKRYITKPERIYADPLHPSTSDYDVVIPQSTTDAVLIEGSNETLTSYLKDVGGVKVEQRNTLIAGDDVVKVNGNNITVGNYAVSVADGFNKKGVPQDSIYYTTTYTSVATPTANDNYLLILKNGTFAYCTYFDGGRDFPTTNLITNQVFFNEQLRRAYKYDGATWVEYPCTAIARFENAQLAEILPFNTWWWDEVVWENHEADIPAGMQVSVYEDSNGDNYLRVRKGGVIDAGHIFTLENDIYKKVQLPFSVGQEGGSSDGNYTNVMTNIIPEDITPDNLQGFSVSGNNVSEVFYALNPTLVPSHPRWQDSGAPTYFSISFPQAKSINKYIITSYADDNVVGRIANSWVLLGSNDGVHWDVIDEVSNAGFTGVGQSKSFSPTNVKPYSSIKFIVKGTIGNINSYVSVGQIRFYSSVPELNVFVITNDAGTTDVLTSPYSGPTLPVGFTYYHRIGKISIGETANLFGAFPSVSIGIDAAGKYETVRAEIDKKANSSLNNLNSEAMKLVSTLSAPRMSSSSALSNMVVYQAPVSGYVIVYNTVNTTLVYNHSASVLVSQNSADALAGGSAPGIPCSVCVAQGSYYKINSTGATVMKFVPSVGATL